MRRKRKAFEKKHLAPHEAAERVIEASSQPVSTQAPDELPNRARRNVLVGVIKETASVNSALTS